MFNSQFHTVEFRRVDGGGVKGALGICVSRTLADDVRVASLHRCLHGGLHLSLDNK